MICNAPLLKEVFAYTFRHRTATDIAVAHEHDFPRRPLAEIAVLKLVHTVIFSFVIKNRSAYDAFLQEIRI